MADFRAAPITTLCLVSVLLASTAIIGARMVLAAPLASDVVGDGPPTREACIRLGFAGKPKEGSYARAVAVAPGYGGAAPPPPTARMAPPSPGVGRTLSQNVPAPTYVQPSSPAAAQAGIYAPPRMETERYPDATPNPVKRVAEAPVSTFSIDVDTASYANVRRFLNDGKLPPRDAVRVEELVNYFDYGYAKPASADTPFRATATMTPSPWAPGKEIIHIGLQGYDVPRSEQPPLNLVFLVDVSGSMSPEDRLPLAQKSLNVLIDQLRPEDRVSMVVYAGAAGAVLEPTDGRQKLKMRCAVNALSAGGSTAGGEGLALAYTMAERNFDKTAINRVVLMTDGDFNVGVADPAKLKDFVAEKRKTGVYLSVFGFGRRNYNDVMMQTLSQTGIGTAAYIDGIEEARKQFRDDFSSGLFPIADDVKIQVEFNPARVAEYRLIGYETRLLKREDFNNDQVDAGEVGAGAAVTALYEVTPVGGPLASDPLRYQNEAQPAAAKSGEIALLRVRYKPAGRADSKLMEQPIGDADRVGNISGAPDATRFALAVAAYGQRLRGEPYMAPGFGWQQIRTLAEGARGRDATGERAQFVQLIRAAEAAKSVNE